MSFLSTTSAGGQSGHGAAGAAGAGLVPSAQDLARRGSIGVTPTRSRRRSTVGNVLQTAESIKERQVFHWFWNILYTTLR